MRKIPVICLLLGMLLLPAMSTAETDVPHEVRQLLGEVEVLSAAGWEEEEQSTWFVYARTQDGTSTLCCFVDKNGAWAEEFRTQKAVPQGNGRTELHISDGAWSFRVPDNSKGQYIKGPILILLQYDADNTAVDWLISFMRSQAGVWELIAIRNYSRAVSIDVGSNGLTFYATADKAQSVAVGCAPCCFDRDIRSFCLAEVPLTFQQAQEQAFSALSPAQ